MAHPDIVAQLEAKLAQFSEAQQRSEGYIDTLLALAWEIALTDTRRSRQLTEKAKPLIDALHYRAGEASYLRNIGYFMSLSSELENALPILQEALKHFRELNDRAGEATALDIFSLTLSRLGLYDRALGYSLESLELNREIGNRRGEAWALHNIGGIYFDTGDPQKAIEHYKEALAIFEKIDYNVGASRILNLMGECYLKNKNFDLALACNRQSLLRYQSGRVTIGQLSTSVTIANIYLEMNMPATALPYLNDARKLMVLIDNKEMKAQLMLTLSKYYQQQNDPQEQLAYLQEACRLIDETAAKPTAIKTYEALFRFHEAAGQTAAALADLKHLGSLRESVFKEESLARLRNVQIVQELAQAEQAAEIHRLRYVELAEMQAQLIQSEKLVMLGNLVAGIAHEVNNPVGVIKSNGDIARRAVGKLRVALGSADGISMNIARPLEVLESSTESTLSAARQIADLVERLKNFARLDEADLQEVNIHEGIDNTLALLNTRLSEGIRIIRDYCEVPVIRCYPQELNQVFLTLLTNAVEAIDGEGQIAIRTSCSGENVHISIEDSGRGIPREKLATIFDIGFSRKEQTVRMNVGLANTYSIIQKHNGTIYVSSQEGAGSHFRITLPLTPYTPISFDAPR